MEAKELLEKLRNWDDEIGIDKYGNDIIDRIPHEDFDNVKMTEDFGEWEFAVLDERGSYGDHDSCKTIIYFKEHNVYAGIEGWYSSAEGSNYESAEWEQYFPKVIKKTIFETKP